MKPVRWCALAALGCSVAIAPSAAAEDARVAKGSILRWRRGDQTGVKVAGSDQEYEIVATVGGDVRLQVPAIGAHLLFWANESALAPAIVRRTPLGPNVELRPGAPVTVRQRRGGRVRVRLDAGGVVVEGEVAASAIGRRFMRGRYEAPGGEVVTLRRGVRVRATPRGVVIATVSGLDDADMPRAEQRVSAVGAAVAGWREVVVLTDDVRVRGFVRSDDVVLERAAMYGGFGFGRPPANVTLGRGTCLHDRPGGEVVGVISSDQSWPTRDAGDGWIRVTVPSRAASVEVAARPGAPCPASDR
jgi:hypothetical protein